MFFFTVKGNDNQKLRLLTLHFLTLQKHGYLDRYDTHLIMIPGFEGHHHIFKTIAERLKVRAATLQLGPDIINGSIPEMAAKLTEVSIIDYKKKMTIKPFHLVYDGSTSYFSLQLILTNFEKTSKFYILGYSFGVNVALEVAKLFEAEGLNVFLDRNIF